ncbi:hypothetical protein FISHEDRAFT_74298 [Fistulina hepatica ATCC 64428]|uniref:CoA-dependent acyltransferase n=1 Tax=Fistulina hepatica ATCC 64428 TaxID=1128425 RepID=A0A0D7ABG9_9AGAR|nr:hypothetical protein FISHEDRAFT_74298 [Fistulina hepatica ATCC 64428]
MTSIDFSSFDYFQSTKPYEWRPDPAVAGRLVRRPAGAELIEDIWNFHNYGEQNLFVGVYASLASAVSADDLQNALRRAWTRVRFLNPLVASKILHNETGAILLYDAAKSEAEVDTWARATTFLHERTDDVTDLDALRYKIGQAHIPAADLEWQTELHLMPIAETKFGLLIRTSHVPFDGAGVKIVMTTVLQNLAERLTGVVRPALIWGTEGKNLLPAMSLIPRKVRPPVLDANGNVVEPDRAGEAIENPVWKEEYDGLLRDIIANAPHLHPFKSLVPGYDPSKIPPHNRRATFEFSTEETALIDSARILGPNDKLSFNHIALACVFLVTLIDNPPEKDSDSVFWVWLLNDVRNRLTHEYAADPLAYPGYALAESLLSVPVSVVQREEVITAATITKDDILKVAIEVRKGYKKQADMKALLSTTHALAEWFISAPPSPPHCGPLYSGDGKGALYLHPKYNSSKDPERPPVIVVDDFFLGLNKSDPGPFFRTMEWKGRLKLSADYNEHAVEPKVVDGWVQLWAKLLRLFAGIKQ